MSIVLGICGGSGSGKTTTVREIIFKIKGNVTFMSSDNYYKGWGHLPLEERHKINFDHPDAIDFALMAEHLKLLREEKTVEVPVYDYVTHTRKKETILLKPEAVIVVEGILIFAIPEIRRLIDIKVFIDTPPDERLTRRAMRDVIERGRSYPSVLEQWSKTVRPMHEQFVEPSKQYADIIIPGGYNEVAVAMIVALINNLIKKDRSEG